MNIAVRPADAADRYRRLRGIAPPVVRLVEPKPVPAPALPRQFGNRAGSSAPPRMRSSRRLPPRPAPVQPHLSTAQIIAAIAGQWGLTSADILGRQHAVAIVDARHNAIWRVWRDHPRLTPVAIGRIFHREHTTIRSAIVRWQRLIDEGVAQP